ncbi:unnamed protein product [Victoria cruziana]
MDGRLGRRVPVRRRGEEGDTLDDPSEEGRALRREGSRRRESWWRQWGGAAYGMRNSRRRRGEVSQTPADPMRCRGVRRRMWCTVAEEGAPPATSAKRGGA